MSSTIPSPFVEQRDFLPEAMAAAVLDFAIANQAAFVPTTIYRKGVMVEESTFRRSLRFKGKLGQLKDDLKAALRASFPDLCRACGMAPFSLHGIEMELAAHRDGGFYHGHIDTLVAEAQADTTRVLTAVYYVNRSPRPFSGGELALYPLAGEGEARLFQPEHNLLVAFPSIAFHEVRPVSLPSDDFGDARFAINCWFERGPAA
mgnify:CR=1 FL=1